MRDPESASPRRFHPLSLAGLGLTLLAGAGVVWSGVLQPPIVAAEDAKSVESPAPPTARSVKPRVEAEFAGQVAPGLRLELRGDRSSGGSLRYLWKQVAGPSVSLEDPTVPVTSFIVPDQEGTLTFVLTVSNPAGMDTTTVSVPIGTSGETTAPGVSPVADAGDDQVAVVGRQVTLNGMRSEPRGDVGYRWLQVGGPQVRLRIQDGYTYSFVPDAPGTYWFALVVAKGGVISEPDVVSVTAGTMEVTGAGPGAPVASPAGASLPPTPAAAPPRFASPPTPLAPPVSLDVLARTGLAALDGGPSAGEALGTAFREVAVRADSLYGTYDELFSELSRMLEVIVPTEPERRQAWLDRLFVPLTSRMIEQLRSEGVDLSSAAGRSASLTPRQRARLAEQLELIARGFDGSRR